MVDMAWTVTLCCAISGIAVRIPAVVFPMQLFIGKKSIIV